MELIAKGVMKRVWASLASLIVGLVVIPLAINHLLYDGIISLVPEDTAYSSDYDEQRFRALTAPISSSIVLEQLGGPLYRSVHEDHSESWIYLRSPADTHYRERIFRIRGDVAVEKIHEFYFD